MTCIVGVEKDGAVYIGADSAATDGWGTQFTISWPKVFRNGPYLFGICGSPRMAQLLQYRLDPPEPGGDLTKFMVVNFVDALRDTFTAGGFGSHKDREEHSGGSFLVGVEGRLFTLFSDYQIATDTTGTATVGSGYQYALGSLHTTTPLDSPRTRIRLALAAAAEYNTGVRGPFVIEKL